MVEILPEYGIQDPSSPSIDTYGLVLLSFEALRRTGVSAESPGSIGPLDESLGSVINLSAQKDCKG